MATNWDMSVPKISDGLAARKGHKHGPPVKSIMIIRFACLESFGHMDQIDRYYNYKLCKRFSFSGPRDVSQMNE